jgi:plastocyanin domain-containing protein
MSSLDKGLPMKTLLLAALTTGIATPAAADPKPRRVEIAVTTKGFEPDRILVKKQEHVMLAFTRKTDSTCAKQVIVDLGGGKKMNRALPLNKTVELDVVFAKAGELAYACSMDMIHGVVVVQ